jgi:site-specific DNA-methyltransferase (adenine-specific)
MSEVKLYLGDCLEILPQLESKSVDAVITDLPYGTTACSWDEIIPFEPMWEQVKRLLKSRGVFVTTASQPFTSKLVMSNLDWFRDEIIWEKSKPVGFLDANRKLLNSHENVLLFSKNGSSTYNPQKWKIPEIYWDRRKTFTILNDETPVYGKRKPKAKRKDDGWRYPISIISIDSEWCKGMHTTQKPVALYDYLIRTYTNEGDIVLDFVMGSGTTGVACINTNRNFLGVEIKPEYFTIAEKRIKEAQMQLRMEV